MADSDDNEDVISALKNPAQFRANQFFPQRPEGAITQWAVGQGEKVKSGLEDMLKHPENLPTTGNLTGVMAGPLARTANMNTYHDALGMVLGDKSREAINRMTGWYPRTEGQLAYEIPYVSSMPRKIVNAP